MWPAAMRRNGPTAGSLDSVPRAEDAAESAPDPAVQTSERGRVAVLEVLKPAPQDPVHFPDDLVQAPGPQAPGLGPDRLFEFVQALLTRPSVAALEVVAQKIKAALLCGVDNARLGRMQDQPCLFRPLAQLFEHCLSLGLALAHHHEVVSVAHHLP